MKLWRTIGAATAVLAVGVLGMTSPAAAQRPIKVFISIDMEGITGVVSSDQLGPGSFEYDKFRQYMTSEALAAMAGAREAGATEFVVADSHGNMQNLLIDQFPDDVTIIRGGPRPWSMMQGIDSTFSAAMFIGYHAATTDTLGIRAHTMSSAMYAGVKLNGKYVPEAGVNAALAGSVGVPVVLVSGDDRAVGAVKALLGDVEGAIVKHAIGFHAGATLTPAAGQALIKAKAKAAIARLSSFRPYVLTGPYVLDLTYKNYRPAEVMAYLPGIERVDAHTVRFTGRTMGEVSRFLVFADTYRGDLTP